MRVPALRIVGPRNLEAPRVVAKIRTSKQADFGEVDEVSIDRRLIDPDRGHLIDEISVGEWLGGM